MDEKKYQPIDCNYYDRLEAWATTGAFCDIWYYGQDGVPAEMRGVIRDLYVREQVEYLLLEDGRELRLDLLLSVNDIPLPGSC